MKLTDRIIGIVRQVVWPYDVFQKTEAGNIEYDYSDNERPPDPKVDTTASWTARITSLFLTLVAIDKGIKDSTGLGIIEWIDRLL